MAGYKHKHFYLSGIKVVYGIKQDFKLN